jgi:uncharacterized membrane protein YkvA (DUF1232 family)
VGLFIFLQRIKSIWPLMQHPAVPKRLKALPIAAFVYLMSPRDIIFDYGHGFLGAFDDVLVVTLLLGIFISKATPYVTAEEKEKADAIDVEFRVLMQQERGDAADSPSADAGDAPGAHDDDGTPHDDLRKH